MLAGLAALLPAIAGGVKKITGGGSKGTDWLGVANVGAGLLEGANQTSQQNQTAEQQRNELAERKRQFDLTQGQQQGSQALAATQMDPFAQQKQRQRQALLEQLLKGMKPVSYADGKFSGGLNEMDPALMAKIGSYFTPGARQAAEGQFAGAANAASAGKYGQPDYAALGYPAGATPTQMPTAPSVTPTPQPEVLKRIFASQGKDVRY